MDNKFIPKRWKTILALILAAIAFKFNLLFVWGMFCLFWGVENIRAKEAYFVERIARKDNPVLYWVIIATWLGSGALYFYMDETIFNLINRI